MEETLEIRRLQASHVKKLSETLDFDDNWKVLMDKIPKQLERENFTSVDENNRPKYNGDHMRLIENEAKKLQKSCTEILFDEWGTSGKIRPTLGHLRYILQKAKLYTADSYVAVKILKKQAPSRPSTGPAAKILISELETEDIDEIPNKNPEGNLVDNANPDLSLLMRDSDAGHVEAVTHQGVHVGFSEQENAGVPNFSLINASVDQAHGTTSNNKSSYVSSDNQTTTDYSTEESFNNVESEIDAARLAENPSKNSSSEYNDEQTNITSDDCIPQISELLAPSSQNASKLESVDDGSMIPDFSGLMSSGNTSDHVESCGDLPQLSELMSTRESDQSKSNDLSVTIKLPHFSYSDIQDTTQQFNESLFSPEDLKKGRFLGSGRLGSAYLTTKLADKTVVVKKFSEEMDLNQFQLELGILSRYKHDNLVSLLGYSVDGPSCCLVMEYMEGGSLRDRLQCSSKLRWKDRLKVALHTSRGIYYLHTVFETPLVHKNIKPSNILLDSENNSKLADFGLSLVANSDGSVYLPPEASASNYKVSVKLDIFSYGVVLLELLTSLAHFDANRKDREHIVTHVMETCQDGNVAHLLDTSVGSWKENDTDFGQDMFEIAQKCLADEPKKRGYIEYVNEQMTRLYNLATDY